MKPGSVILCVDDSNWDEYARKDFSEPPISKRLYTVRRVIPNIIDPSGPDGIALAEIFGAWHFLTTLMARPFLRSVTSATIDFWR